MLNIDIKEINDATEKGQIVTTILATLPEYFGIEESTKQYVVDAYDSKMWAAYAGDELIGFINLKPTSKQTAELRCMGIKPEFQRKKVGTKLFANLNHYAKSNYSFLQVKTVAEGNYDIYDKTIQFYENLGFVQLEVFPELWDEHNPCLVLVMKL